MLALGAPLDPCAVYLLAVATPLRRGQRVVEGVEGLDLEAGVRACVAERDPDIGVVRAFREQLAEDRLAFLLGAGLQQVPAAHPARHGLLTAAGVERFALEPCRHVVVVVVGCGLCELVVQVTERHGQLVAATGKAVERLLGLQQRWGVDLRLQDRVGDRHDAIVDRPAATPGSAARSFRSISAAGAARAAESKRVAMCPLADWSARLVRRAPIDSHERPRKRRNPANSRASKRSG